MRLQSASSSSASSIGSVVQMPCPISECASSTVTLSSAPMRRNAFGAGRPRAGAGCAPAARPPPGTRNPITRPPPASAPLFRKSRRPCPCVISLLLRDRVVLEPGHVDLLGLLLLLLRHQPLAAVVVRHRALLGQL